MINWRRHRLHRAPWVNRLVLLPVLSGLFVMGQALPAFASLPEVTSPLATQHEIEANPPIAVPATMSCTEQIMSHTFANSYGQPYTGPYVPPPDCPGPWSKVVLTFTATVGGDQYDRMVEITLGHAIFLEGSTSEPCCTGDNSVTWTVQRDVTQYSSLLSQPQSVLVELDNVYNSTYDGEYVTTASLTFYDSTAKVPAAAVPSAVVPLTGTPLYDLSSAGQQAGTTVKFPSSLVGLTAELFADGHGPCEEFWWGDPNSCAGTPYREVAVYIDGQLAGAAPVYPTTFTGADGPQFWEPIPSPRAWDLRPYDVDLTPFVGELVDGQPHTFTLGVLGATYTSGDYWQLGANLLESTDPGQVTSGGVTTVDAPAHPANDIASGAVTYSDEASHDLKFSGYIIGTGGARVVTTVTDTMGEQASQTPATTDGVWSWDQKVTTSGVGPTSTVDTDLGYGLQSVDLSRYSFIDKGTTTTTVGGKVTALSSFMESMTTSAVIETVNGIESEAYSAQNADGSCYRHVLQSDAGEIIVNQLSDACTGPLDVLTNLS